MTNGAGEVVSVGDAAERLGLGTATIRRLLKEGKLEGYPKTDSPQSPWLIFVSSIDAYDARRRAAGRAKQRRPVEPAVTSPES